MSLKGKELTDKRIECNQEILRKLSEYLAKNPDIRFSQSLSNLNIVISACDNNNEWYNDYYNEPEVILKRMR